MLIRFIVDNVLSFGEEREFNMLPNKRLRTLNHHKYNNNGFELLKMTSIYGANGAGKSNLVKSLGFLVNLVVDEEISLSLKKSVFKFKKENSSKSIVLAVEFFQDSIPFLYAIEIENDIILNEELYRSGLGESKDELIFERSNKSNGKVSLKFSKKFDKNDKIRTLKSILLEEFITSEKPVFGILAKRENKLFKQIKTAYKWFDETIELITPTSRPSALVQGVDADEEFRNYAKDIMCSFNLGIKNVSAESKNIDDFFGEDGEEEIEFIRKTLSEKKGGFLKTRTHDGEEIIFVEENGDIISKRLRLEHIGGGITANFDMTEESDGTVRLLEFIPAFKMLVSNKKVFIIDEIERSIHPLLIKELLNKFSKDLETNGQLIFTTHESNLLDQEIFRQDEIWFAEKDSLGSTDLYSLSDFKEHKTIDIQKGYLSGRYGGIPFLGNLKELNWHEYDSNEQVIYP